jgi:hypothetical protein
VSHGGRYSYAGARFQGSVDHSWTRVKDGIVFDLTRTPFTYGNIGEYGPGPQRHLHGGPAPRLGGPNPTHRL